MRLVLAKSLCRNLTKDSGVTRLASSHAAVAHHDEHHYEPAYKHKIGKREIVGFGFDGNPEYAFRWPDVVISGLPEGKHTLTITVQGPGTYPGTLAYIDSVIYSVPLSHQCAKVQVGWNIYQ